MFQTSTHQHNGAKYFVKFKMNWKVHKFILIVFEAQESLDLGGANSDCLFLLFFLNP